MKNFSSILQCNILSYELLEVAQTDEYLMVNDLQLYGNKLFKVNGIRFDVQTWKILVADIIVVVQHYSINFMIELKSPLRVGIKLFY